MQTFIKLFVVVFAIILFAGISQQRELIAVWMGQASKALGFRDEIYQWNTDIAWEKTDREHEAFGDGQLGAARIFVSGLFNAGASELRWLFARGCVFL